MENEQHETLTNKLLITYGIGLTSLSSLFVKTQYPSRH